MNTHFSTPTKKICCSLLAVALLVSPLLNAHAASVGAASERPSVPSEQAAHAYLLGVAQAGKRLVAVGERGIVLLSDTEGATWRQVQTPVSVTLTVVRFADARHGYIAGHGGTVLVTSDAGETWNKSLDGKQIAEIVLSEATATGDAKALADAVRQKSEGADKPLLDMFVRDAQNIVVVGAYGLMLSTVDGGQHWQSWGHRLNNPRGLHLNAIRGFGDQMVIVGEQGLMRLSRDQGATFTSLKSPYAGSFFTVEMPASGVIIAAGLRGNVLRSDNFGEHWTALISPVPASVTSSTITADGELLLANQAGLIMKERAGRLVPVNPQVMPAVNNLLALADGKLIVLSAEGVATSTSGENK